MNYDYCYFISKAGELPADRLQRKCSQLQGLVLPLQKIAAKRCSSPQRSKFSIEENKFSSEVGRRCIIVDFCSGGGHLGLLLAHLIPQVGPIDIILKVSNFYARTYFKHYFEHYCQADKIVYSMTLILGYL